MSKTSFGAVIAIAAAAFIAASAPAQAEATRTQHVTVSHSDLDLTTSTGLATFKHRVERAAQNACGPVAKFPSPAFESYEACHQAAITTAAATVDQAVAEARTKHQFAAVQSN